jgi:hypothetical protein
MKISHDKLLMPEGKIPLPAWVPKKALYPGSLFEFYSRRLDRTLFLTSRNEFLFALMVEFSPQVRWFLEHYPEVRLLINNKHVKTTFDMLLRFVSGEFLLVEIKPTKTQLSSREKEQIMRQTIFAELFQIPYIVIEENRIKCNMILINNLQDMVGYLPFVAENTVKEDILDFVEANQPVKIRDVVNFLHNYDSNEVTTGIVH